MTARARYHHPIVGVPAVLVICALLCLVCDHVNAQTVINFQGVLVDDEADPDTGEEIPLTGARTIAVRLWNRAIAGATGEELLWARAYRVNLNADGYFSLLIGVPGVDESGDILGDGFTPTTDDLDVALIDGPAYLGLTVIRDENGELTNRDEYYPRRQLLSAPFALFTDFATHIGTQPEEEETPPRFKYTTGQTASTQVTTLDAPTVVVAEVRDFPVRPGALLRVRYSGPLEFNYEELFPLQDINTEFPPPKARVTLDVRANNASLARIRTDQAHTRPEYDLVLPEGPEKVRPVFLNWVGVVNADLDDTQDTLVSVDVRLSMFETFDLAPVERVIDVDRPTISSNPDIFRSDLGTGRNDDQETVSAPRFNVRHGDMMTWQSSEEHEIVFLGVLGGALDFSLDDSNTSHTVVIPEALPVGATIQYQCSVHPPRTEAHAPGEFTVVRHLDSVAIADTAGQRLVLEEILPDQLDLSEP